MKNVRTLVVGMIAGAVLATSATAFAGPVTSKISALLRPDYTVTVNGKQIKNAPINYNGTTYLPLREVSDAFGSRITLQGKNINITSEEVLSVPDSSGSQKPTEIKTYEVGETVETPNFKYKVNGVTYVKSHGGFVAGSGEVFAVINFDVLTEIEPQYKVSWSPVDCLDIFTTDTGKQLMGSSFSIEKIKIGEWNTVNVSKTIPEGQKIKSVEFSDPIIRDRNFYSVVLSNQ